MRREMTRGGGNSSKPLFQGITPSIQNKKILTHLLLVVLLFASIAIVGGLGYEKAYAIGQIHKTSKIQNSGAATTTNETTVQQTTSQLLINQSQIQQQPSSQNATIHSFEDAFARLVNDTRNLSLAYQDEVAKFHSGIYDAQTFVTITDIYLQMYERLLERADTLQRPASLPMNYSKAIDLYSNSIRAEMLSHEHYLNYLTTGDLAENERSLELLSDSLRFEIEAFRAFESAASNTTTVIDGSDKNTTNPQTMQ